MKRPLWMTIVGIVALFIGFWGMVGNLLTVLTPMDLGAPPNIPPPVDLFNEPQVPWTHTPAWIKVTGFISFLIATLYFVAGVLFLVKVSGITVLYGAVIASILWTILRTLTVSQGDMTTMMVLGPMALPGITIDVVLGAAAFLGTRMHPPPSSRSPAPTPSDTETPRPGNPLDHRMFVITGSFFLLCVMVFPFWIMGIPGVKNTYARGWDMGFYVLVWFPILWGIIWGISWVLRKIFPVDWHPTIERVTSIIFMIGLVVALIRLGQAITLMVA